MVAKRSYGWATLVIVLAGVAINLIGVRLATGFGWLLFLDSIGTMLAAALGGLLPGIVVGFSSNVINGIADPITMYYGIVSVLLAVMTRLLVQRGAFRRLWTALLSAIPLSILGGGLGSLLTWILYGFDFGSGISAPLALMLHESFGLGKFTAQFSADMAVDLADKLLSVLLCFLTLRFLPRKLRDAAPYGYLFGRDGELPPTLPSGRLRTGSLRNKIAAILALTACILTLLSFAISSTIYRDVTNDRYISTGQNACALLLQELDGDQIDAFLADGDDSAAYQETEQSLQDIKDCIPDILYLYVYQIREDGCHVVFDLDTEDLPGADPGSVIAFEPAFEKYIPALLAGEEIEPVVSNDAYGWLLTIYRPVRNSDGQCVAYAAVDISMENVITDRYVFAIRLICLMFGASIIIISLAIFYMQSRIVAPIDTLADATLHFAFDSETERKRNSEKIQALDIHTRDEIENLYLSISKTVTDMAGYIDQVAANSAFIGKLQDNIILSFADMVENRDENTGSHIKRTGAYVSAIGAALLKEGRYSETLTDESLRNYIKSAPLHDIGKIKIPDSILNKPGRLTAEEFAIIKTHTTEGRNILLGALHGIENSSYLKEAMDMAAYHHERWDGAGYPAGLKGEAIPLCARIMALADVFDALLSKRSYKEPFTFEESTAIIRGEAGSHFDPVVVEAFLQIGPEIRKLSEI